MPLPEPPGDARYGAGGTVGHRHPGHGPGGRDSTCVLSQASPGVLGEPKCCSSRALSAAGREGVRHYKVHQGHGELALGTRAKLDPWSAGNVAGEGASPCWGLRGLSAEEGEELLERKHSVGTSTVGYKRAVIKCLQEMRRSVRLPAAGFWKNLQEKA